MARKTRRMKLAAIFRQATYELSLDYYDHTAAKVAPKEVPEASPVRQLSAGLDSAGLLSAGVEPQF